MLLRIIGLGGNPYFVIRADNILKILEWQFDLICYFKGLCTDYRYSIVESCMESAAVGDEYLVLADGHALGVIAD